MAGARNLQRGERARLLEREPVPRRRRRNQIPLSFRGATRFWQLNQIAIRMKEKLLKRRAAAQAPAVDAQEARDAVADFEGEGEADEGHGGEAESDHGPNSIHAYIDDKGGPGSSNNVMLVPADIGGVHIERAKSASASFCKYNKTNDRYHRNTFFVKSYDELVKKMNATEGSTFVWYTSFMSDEEKHRIAVYCADRGVDFDVLRFDKIDPHGYGAVRNLEESTAGNYDPPPPNYGRMPPQEEEMGADEEEEEEIGAEEEEEEIDAEEEAMGADEEEEEEIDAEEEAMGADEEEEEEEIGAEEEEIADSEHVVDIGEVHLGQSSEESRVSGGHWWDN